MSLIILTQNDCYNFHRIINIALLKATVDNKLLLKLHCTDMMAKQRSSDYSLTECFVQQSNQPASSRELLQFMHWSTTVSDTVTDFQDLLCETLKTTFDLSGLPPESQALVFDCP